jgi:hypothetical protein
MLISFTLTPSWPGRSGPTSECAASPKVRVKAIGRQPSPSSGRGSATAGNAARPATFRTLGPGPSAPPGAPVNSPRPSTNCSYAKHSQDGKGSRRRQSGSSISAVRIERTAHPVPRGGVSAGQRVCVVRDRIELSTFRFSEGLSSVWEPLSSAAPQPALPAEGPVESLRQ